MATLYWAGQYAAVFFGYYALMFLWPSLVFRRHLRQKGKLYRFSFCVTVQIVLINTIILGLGFFHILNRWMVLLIFYGIPVLSYLRGISREHISERVEQLYRVATGACGIRTFLRGEIKTLTNGLRKQCGRLWEILRPRFGEYILLLVILIYGMIYFSYNAFLDYSYGFGDLYVHHSWIQGLIDGKVFSGGVYPEGMHCFIYCLHTLFGIRVYSILLFLAGIHVIVFLISAFGLLREVFHSRYTPFFVLALFLLLDVKSVNAVYAMSRLQYTVPQEFGLFAQFLCARYLVRYLKGEHRILFKGKHARYFWDENLFLFMMALSASIVTHYYVTIMAFLLCASFAVVFLRRIFSKEWFLPLVVSTLCGLIVAVTPILAARASGIPFERSMSWAMGVINHTDPDEEASDEVFYNVGKEKNVAGEVFRRGYCEVYGDERASHIALFTEGMAILWLIYRIGAWILRNYFRKQIDGCRFDGYPPIIIASVLFMVVYASGALGLPQLIAGSRLCAVEQLLIIAVMVMPFDLLLSAFGQICCETGRQYLAILGVVGTYMVVLRADVLHGPLYIELTRYNSSVMVTQSIIEKFPKHSYTIVSTTDEMYQMIQDGYHEEWQNFLINSKKSSYKLPTKYVFLYVEKRPLSYAQVHLFNGPPWLVSENHIELFSSIKGGVSQCPEIIASQISEKMAKKEWRTELDPWEVYTDLESRTIVESKAYEWCQHFSKLYPYEWRVGYEDENFVCFYFEQEPGSPYNLAVGDENGGR
ncbi:MAG: hypothetical protein HFH53_03550 [Hespellia sp.]|nr:hypothetical protein [Hespellia sp.]